MYSNKDFHLTCNALLHYLVKVVFKNSSDLDTYTQLNRCRILVFVDTLLPQSRAKNNHFFHFRHFAKRCTENHVSASATTKSILALNTCSLHRHTRQLVSSPSRNWSDLHFVEPAGIKANRIYYPEILLI